MVLWKFLVFFSQFFLPSQSWVRLGLPWIETWLISSGVNHTVHPRGWNRFIVQPPINAGPISFTIEVVAILLSLVGRKRIWCQNRGSDTSGNSNITQGKRFWVFSWHSHSGAYNRDDTGAEEWGIRISRACAQPWAGWRSEPGGHALKRTWRGLCRSV